MFKEHLAQLKTEAIAAYPNEAVWLITSGECRQVANKADDPTKTFKVDRRSLTAAYKRGLLAVVHSHPNYYPCPSAADMRAQAANAVPWGILATDGTNATDVVWFGDQLEPPPLLDRTFCHGVTDCYSLIRDYYRIEHSIILPEFPRDWGWWEKGLDLYQDGFEVAGFTRLDFEAVSKGKLEPKPGDVWLAQIRSPVPNHGGVYIGDELTIHHVTSANPIDTQRLSAREPIHRWMPHITHWLRRKEWV